MTIDLNFLVGGEAGQGVQTVGFLLAKTFVRAGYHVFADQDYESRIRGGHNFFRIRVSENELGAVREDVDVLVALNRETVDRHLAKLTGRGVCIADAALMSEERGDRRIIGVPLEKLAGSKLMANTAALGAALGLVNLDTMVMEIVLAGYFGQSKAAEDNIAAARAGYAHVRQGWAGKLPAVKTIETGRRMLLTGNDAICLGAIAAGCRFMAAYPMTPASSIMEYMATKSAEAGIVMVHAEDEIAAVNMAIGASYAGLRAMTATSGSGFCLMVEGLGLAGITETPLVIVDAQRPGPAVGMPTRTEQGDLQFVLRAHHGDFPRAVLAPISIEDAFWVTVRAFNWADKYQLPVIILTDHHLATSYATVEPLVTSGIKIERGAVYRGDGNAAAYRRHEVTASGISPRAFPGQGQALVVTDCDEHDEAGHLTEDAGIRTAQVQKRLRKMQGLQQELGRPYIYGGDVAAITLIGWGSTGGAIREAVAILRRQGKGVNMVQLNELRPFPAAALEKVLGASRQSYVIEGNATGQLARLIREETGRRVNGEILRFDGRPITPAYIIESLQKEGY